MKGSVLLVLLLALTLYLCSSTVEAQWGRPRVDDLYSDLGVSRGASKKDIKKRFRTLAKDHHPDTAIKPDMSEAEATEVKDRFAKILRAYNILSDDQKRNLYDQQGVIDGENDMQAKQQQQHQQRHGGFGFGNHFFRQRQPSPPIKSAAETLTEEIWKRRVLSLKGRRISIVQVYHDECYECRLFSSPWESVVTKSTLAHVVNFYRIDAASHEGQHLLETLRLSYPPAPLVFSVVDGVIWPMDSLQNLVVPRNEHRMRAALEKFIESHYTDYTKNYLHGSIGKGKDDIEKWVTNRWKAFGDSRMQVVFSSTCDLHTILAVATSFTNVDVAIAPVGMAQLQHFVETHFKGQKLNSQLGSRSTQKEAVIIFNATAGSTSEDAGEENAAGSDSSSQSPTSNFPLEAHWITSASSFSTKRVLTFIKESLEAPQPRSGGRSKTGGKPNEAAAARRARSRKRLPQWTFDEFSGCVNRGAYCLVVVGTKASCGNAELDSTTFVPDWADPMDAIRPYELFYFCATRDVQSKRYWEILKNRPGAFNPRHVDIESPAVGMNPGSVVTLLAVDGPSGGKEYALFKKPISSSDDESLYDYLAAVLEGESTVRMDRDLEFALNALRQAKKDVDGMSPMSHRKKRLQSAFGHQEVEPSDTAFPVTTFTKMGWYADWFYTNAPLGSLVPIVTMWLLYKLFDFAFMGPPSGGRTTGTRQQQQQQQQQHGRTSPRPNNTRPMTADERAAYELRKRQEAARQHAQQQQQRSGSGTANSSAQARAKAANTAASAKAREQAAKPPPPPSQVCPVFQIPYLCKEDYQSESQRPFLIIAFSTVESAAAIPYHLRVDQTVRNDPKLCFRKAREKHQRWWELLKYIVGAEIEKKRATQALRQGPVWFLALRTSKKMLGVKPADVSLSEWVAGLLHGSYVASYALPGATASASPSAATSNVD